MMHRPAVRFLTQFMQLDATYTTCTILIGNKCYRATIVQLSTDYFKDRQFNLNTGQFFTSFTIKLILLCLLGRSQT